MSTASRKGKKAGAKAAPGRKSGSTARRAKAPGPSTKARVEPARPASKGSKPRKGDDDAKKRAPDVEIDPDALEFIEAIDRFKREHGKPFPTWSEVLWVVRSLGYAKD